MCRCKVKDSLKEEFANTFPNTFWCIDTSIDKNIFFARGSSYKLLPRDYSDDIFTENHKEADTKLICLRKQAINLKNFWTFKN